MTLALTPQPPPCLGIAQHQGQGKKFGSVQQHNHCRNQRHEIPSVGDAESQHRISADINHRRNVGLIGKNEYRHDQHRQP